MSNGILNVFGDKLIDKIFHNRGLYKEDKDIIENIFSAWQYKFEEHSLRADCDDEWPRLREKNLKIMEDMPDGHKRKANIIDAIYDMVIKYKGIRVMPERKN